MNVTEDDLKEAFEKLPPRMQAVLALRAAGYTQHEVGTVVQISRTTVWSDETEGYAQLRHLLTN